MNFEKIIDSLLNVLSFNVRLLINLIEKMINNQCYYQMLLSGLAIVFVLIIIIGLFKRVKFFNFSLNESIQLIGITFIGIIISFFKLDINKNLECLSAPKIIMVLITLFLFILFIVESIRYSKTIPNVLIHMLKIYIVAVKFEVFFLAMLNRLDINELLLAWLCILALNFLNEIFVQENNNQENNNQENNEQEKEIKTNHKPIEEKNELFFSRQKQLESVKNELLSKFNEINSVIIAGDWGTGKSSFINVLKKELLENKNEKAEIVNVECGIECDLKQILNSISSQIEKIMKKNKIYIKHDSIIHKYFKSIYRMVEDTDYKFITSIGHIFEDKLDDFSSLRIEMNKTISILGNKIYIFIDDLDRILAEEDRINILKVIYESINLDNCLTIFSVDKEEFLGKNSYLSYIEKYVDLTINLTNVTFEKIIDTYEKEYFSNNFISSLNENLINDSQIGKMIKDIYNKILDGLQKQEKVKNANKKIINQDINSLMIASKNPRKVKHLLQIIKNMIEISNNLWFINDHCIHNEYTDLNWIEYIIRIAFLNVFYNKRFNFIYLYNDINNFRNDGTHQYLYNIVLKGIKENYRGKKVGLYDLLFFQIYTMDSSTDKTYNQKIKEELEKNDLNEKHFNRYLHECIGLTPNYTYAKNVITFIENQDDAENYLDLFMNHYMNYGNNPCYIEYAKNKDILKDLISLIERILANNKGDINKVVQSIEGIIGKNLESYIHGLHELVYFVRYKEAKGEDVNIEYPKLSKINHLKELAKFINKNDKEYDDIITSLKNYINYARDLVEKEDEEELFIRDIFLETISYINNILELVEMWNKEVNRINNNKIYCDLPKVNSYEELDSYLCKLEKLIIADELNVDLNMFNSLQRYVQDLKNSALTEVQKNHLKKRMESICVLLNKKNILKYVDKEDWNKFRMEVFCLLVID